jgi:hypothetical protein
MENDIERVFLVVQQINSREENGLKERIIDLLNDLIAKDFDQLIQLLYRVDVSENKLKKLLHDHPETNAAILITELLIERQLEKIKTKQSFGKQNDIADEEKW